MVKIRAEKVFPWEANTAENSMESKAAVFTLSGDRSWLVRALIRGFLLTSPPASFPIGCHFANEAPKIEM